MPGQAATRKAASDLTRRCYHFPPNITIYTTKNKLIEKLMLVNLRGTMHFVFNKVCSTSLTR